MKNYRNSDYAVNKYADGIVYLFADGAVEITLADYLRENPGKTAADFTALKVLSDGIYARQQRDTNRQTYKNVPLHSLEDAATFAAPTPDDLLCDLPEQAKRDNSRRQHAYKVLDVLTETQRRRYVLYKANGMTTREIAHSEGVKQRTVMDSLELAEKKIKKYFSSAAKKTSQNG